MKDSNKLQSGEKETRVSKPTKSMFPLITALILMILVTVVICAFQLKTTEIAIITTFGKPKIVKKAGLHRRLPWPIQKVVKLDNRVQLFTGGYRETTTHDNINLIVSLFATWRITDPLLYFNSVGNKHEAESILKSLLESKQESIIRSHNLSDFLSTGSKETTLADIERELLESLSSQAEKTYGITLDYIGFAQIKLNENTTTSVFERMKQEQAKIVAEIRSEGEKKSKIIRDNADNLKAQKLAEAEADAKRIRGEALIKAAEQYDEFKEDLDFAIFLRKLDALEETMKTKTTIILDPKTPPYDLLQFEAKQEQSIK